MGSKSTFMRVLFFVCLVAGPVLMACEAVLDFDRSKIQHYNSSDGAASTDDGTGDGTGTGGGSTGTDSGSTETDSGSGSTDAGKDADTGT